ncbi:reverse transcriptase domain-containing protein [Tanacetum coccineum]
MSGSPNPSSDPVVEPLSPSLTPFGDSDFLLEETDAFLSLDDSIPPDLKREEKEQLLKVLKSHKRAIAWKISDIQGIDPRFYTHKIIMKDDFKPTVQHQRWVNPKIHEVIKAEVIKLLDVGLIYPISDSPWMVFLDNFKFSLIPKTRKRLPSPVLMEHLLTEGCLSVFAMLLGRSKGDSFSSCLSHLDMMLKWCEDTNLVLNWEKCHFMVKEGIILGHKISKSGIEVDRAKVDVIAKLPPLTTVKGIRSFLGHADFYRRFIQDFSKIARPITHLLEKDTPFFFSDECLASFEILKKKLTEAPILMSSDWDLPFELMCDASDFVVGAILRQRNDKYFKTIHYASKTLSDAQTHYTTTEKELLAVVYTFEKFRSYLVLSKTIVLENPHQGDLVDMEMNDNFPHESLNMISPNPDNEPLLKIFSGKLKSRWSGPFTVAEVFPYGTVELSQPDGPNFKVNRHRIKHYYGGDILAMDVPDLHLSPKDN